MKSNLFHWPKLARVVRKGEGFVFLSTDQATRSVNCLSDGIIIFQTKMTFLSGSNVYKSLQIGI